MEGGRKFSRFALQNPSPHAPAALGEQVSSGAMVEVFFSHSLAVFIVYSACSVFLSLLHLAALNENEFIVLYFWRGWGKADDYSTSYRILL